MIRRAAESDFQSILSLIDSGRRIMRESGNPGQWPEGKPEPEKIRNDIENGNSWIVEENGVPAATFAFIEGPDPTYARIDGGAWLNEEPYYVIHRIARSQSARGVFRTVMDWCFGRTGNIRIDTHKDNAIMRHCLESYGFRYCGIIYLENGDERLAYQLFREK